jgi:transcriptional regulator with XRE-family HTH domain
VVSGADIRRVRQRLGMTQYQAAAGIGVSRRTISRYENTPVLHRRVAAKLQKLFWAAARLHLEQDICSQCCGSGLVPKPGAPGILPKIGRLRSDEP